MLTNIHNLNTRTLKNDSVDGTSSFQFLTSFVGVNNRLLMWRIDFVFEFDFLSGTSIRTNSVYQGTIIIALFWKLKGTNYWCTKTEILVLTSDRNMDKNALANNFYWNFFFFSVGNCVHGSLNVVDFYTHFY